MITGGALWLLLTALGFVLLRSMGKIGHSTGQAIAVRAAAFMFVAAGVIGATGWIGEAQQTGIRVVNQTGNAATAAMVGASAVWVGWLIMCLAWVAGIVPESWFSFQIPDWLSISGLFLPSLTALLPSRAGDFFGGLFSGIGNLMIRGVQSLFGG